MIFRFFRRFATHRELRPAGWGRGGPRYSGNTLLRTYGTPLAVAGGVLAVNHFVLPYVVDSVPYLLRDPRMAVAGVIGVNAAFFLAWRLPGAPQRFMMRYGLLQKQPQLFRGGQLLGSAFSHQNFWHFFVNMFVLYQFGVPVAQWMGSSTFLTSYLDSAVLSGLGSIVLPALIGRPLLLPSLGASGAVFAMFGIFSYLVPDARLALYFIPLPIGAWSVFLLSMGYNVFAMVSRRGAFMGAGIDYAGHVAGSLCGIFYGWLSQKRIAERRRQLFSRVW